MHLFQTIVQRLHRLDGGNNARSIEIASIRRENFSVFFFCQSQSKKIEVKVLLIKSCDDMLLFGVFTNQLAFNV